MMKITSIITNNWNPIDIIIHKAEICVSRITEAINDSKDDIPDPEVMIMAATEHLREENEQLKKKLYPERIIVKYGNYYCPECHEQLLPELAGKNFCPECGKRIMLHTEN